MKKLRIILFLLMSNFVLTYGQNYSIQDYYEFSTSEDFGLKEAFDDYSTLRDDNTITLEFVGDLLSFDFNLNLVTYLPNSNSQNYVRTFDLSFANLSEFAFHEALVLDIVEKHYPMVYEMFLVKRARTQFATQWESDAALMQIDTNFVKEQLINPHHLTSTIQKFHGFNNKTESTVFLNGKVLHPTVLNYLEHFTNDEDGVLSTIGCGSFIGCFQECTGVQPFKTFLLAFIGCKALTWSDLTGASIALCVKAAGVSTGLNAAFDLIPTFERCLEECKKDYETYTGTSNGCPHGSFCATTEATITETYPVGTYTAQVVKQGLKSECYECPKVIETSEGYLFDIPLDLNGVVTPETKDPSTLNDVILNRPWIVEFCHLDVDYPGSNNNNNCQPEGGVELTRGMQLRFDSEILNTYFPDAEEGDEICMYPIGPDVLHKQCDPRTYKAKDKPCFTIECPTFDLASKGGFLAIDFSNMNPLLWRSSTFYFNIEVLVKDGDEYKVESTHQYNLPDHIPVIESGIHEMGIELELDKKYHIELESYRDDDFKIAEKCAEPWFDVYCPTNCDLNQYKITEESFEVVITPPTSNPGDCKNGSILFNNFEGDDVDYFIRPKGVLGFEYPWTNC